MKNPLESGFLIGSEPLDEIRPRSASAHGDDDATDTKDSDGLDGSDSDGADGTDSDGTDSDGTDGKD
jgi:hypothetical protein